jgi:hypothetical protein
MRIKEIVENWGNRHMHGMGERPQAHYLLELPSETHLLGKIEQTGQVVRILKRVEHVKFSNKPDWLLIDKDLHEKGKELKWLPGDTRFSWVREFSREQIADENIGFSIGGNDASGSWADSGARFKQM